MYSTIAVIHNSIVVQHLRSSEALRASAWTVEAAVRIWLRSNFSASSYRCPCWRIEECSASAPRPVAVPAPALRVASCDAPPASEEEGLRLDSSKHIKRKMHPCPFTHPMNGLEWGFWNSFNTFSQKGFSFSWPLLLCPHQSFWWLILCQIRTH